MQNLQGRAYNYASSRNGGVLGTPHRVDRRQASAHQTEDKLLKNKA